MEGLSQVPPSRPQGPDGQDQAPFDAYTIYYVGQALYQVGGKRWKECYPLLRDAIVDHPDP